MNFLNSAKKPQGGWPLTEQLFLIQGSASVKVKNLKLG